MRSTRLSDPGVVRPGPTPHAARQQAEDTLGGGGRLIAQFRDRRTLPIRGLAQRADQEQVGDFPSVRRDGMAVGRGSIPSDSSSGRSTPETSSEPITGLDSTLFDGTGRCS